VDLKNYFNDPAKLKEDLSKYDFVWVNGGNVFYLRMLMQQSGFDKIIKALVGSGIVYGGDSAGAIVAGPSLKGFERADHIDQVSKVIYEGIGLVDFVPLPHWGTEKFQSALDKIKEDCVRQGMDIEVMTDNQAIIVEGDSRRVIDNPLGN
jgi:dipeptidase E